jgi:poly-gamma-glutamate capsule biosynthesis protein CapA/YwtB (metallophosphatase superfamily)
MGKAKRIKPAILSLKTTLLLAALLAVVVAAGGCKGNVDLPTTQNGTGVNTTAVENETPQADSYARMMCVGDNLIHSNIYQQAKERAGGNGYDFEYAYKQVEDILKLADFAVLNQETVIDKDREPSTFPLFNSPPELGEQMIKIGFNVINHANNHVIDKGVSGALKTIEFWKSHEGVVLTGVYSDEADMNEVKANTVNGINFAHVGVTEYLNGNRLPASAEIKVLSPVGANITREEFFAASKRLIETAKAAADIVCVSVHFQQEDSFTPSSTQKEIIGKLIEYGADVIIGTGPHVLQPIEFVEREDGSRVLVINSLGNFISAQSKAANMIAGIADVRFVKSGETGETKIVSAGLIPIVTHYTSGYRNVRIIPLSDYTAELAANHGVRKFQPKFDYAYVESLLDKVMGEEFLIKDWKNAG